MIFLTVHTYLQLPVDNFCTVHSPSHKKFRSVESFKLTFKVSDKKSFFIYLFLTVHGNSVMTFSQKLRFLNFEIF
jgi:hypothetical protein